MLDVLLAAGLQPDFVVGTSVGAINAGYFAGAPNAETCRGLGKSGSTCDAAMSTAALLKRAGAGLSEEVILQAVVTRCSVD